MGIDELTFVMTAFEQAHRIFKARENAPFSLALKILHNL